MEASALFGAARAQAQPKTEAIRIDYRADARCPTQRAFIDRVFARARAARPALAGEEARTFVVTIDSEGRGFRGRLAIRGPQGPTVSRTVLDARCEDVAEALALSTVLAIDPTSSGDATTTSTAATTSDAAAGEDSSTREQEPETPPTPPAPAAKPQPAPDADADESALAPTARDASAWASTLLVGGDLQLGSSPRAIFGASVAYEARPREPSRLTSLGAELSFLASPSATVSGASSSFQLALARPRACGLAVPLASTLRALPCFAVELGLLTGRGADISEPRTERRFWAAIQLPLRLEAELGRGFLVQLEASLVVPLTRYQFVFLEPETSIYDVAAVGFAAALRVGTTL